MDEVAWYLIRFGLMCACLGAVIATVIYKWRVDRWKQRVRYAADEVIRIGERVIRSYNNRGE